MFSPHQRTLVGVYHDLTSGICDALPLDDLPPLRKVLVPKFVTAKKASRGSARILINNIFRFQEQSAKRNKTTSVFAETKLHTEAVLPRGYRTFVDIKGSLALNTVG